MSLDFHLELSMGFNDEIEFEYIKSSRSVHMCGVGQSGSSWPSDRHERQGSNLEQKYDPNPSKSANPALWHTSCMILTTRTAMKRCGELFISEVLQKGRDSIKFGR